MCINVYRIPERIDDESISNALVCHLRETTPDEAITKLQKAGVLAIPGPDDNSIILVGYHKEIRVLLDFYRLGGEDYRDEMSLTIGKLHAIGA